MYVYSVYSVYSVYLFVWLVGCIIIYFSFKFNFVLQYKTVYYYSIVRKRKEIKQSFDEKKKSTSINIY